jgi:molybdopterin molybdotransferase
MKRISSDEARDMLLALPVARKIESAALAQAVGRVLAEDIQAVTAVPPFDRSPFDGYALRGEDTAEATRENPVTLTITEEIPAGHVPTMPVGPGQAAKILTGGPVPQGANTTVKYEETEFTATQVKIFAPCAPNSNVARAGEDVAVGQTLAQAGEVLTPALVGLLAGQGFDTVKVCAQPKITVISTGSELLEPGKPWQPGKIYNSNTYTICALLQAAGAQAIAGGTVADELEAIGAKITQAFAHSDMVITTGGASVGDYDWAERAAKAIGADILFWKFAMKPGGSCLAAVKDGKLLLSLSGSPGAAMLALHKVGMPYIRKLQGRRDLVPETFEAVMAKDYKKKTTMARVLRGNLAFRDGHVYFEHHEGDGNGILSSLVGCDALGEIPADSPPVQAGQSIQVFRL